MAAARAGHEMGEEESPTSDLTEGADSQTEELLDMHRSRFAAVQAIRQRRDEALAAGNMAEVRYWEQQEESILFL